MLLTLPKHPPKLFSPHFPQQALEKQREEASAESLSSASKQLTCYGQVFKGSQNWLNCSHLKSIAPPSTSEYPALHILPRQTYPSAAEPDSDSQAHVNNTLLHE